MVATNLKEEAIKLMDQRSVLEAEMNSIIERLCQPGGPGVSGNLVDSEGFPRTDIDIPVVRADRHRLAELRNDHKDITEKIDQNIQLLHSARIAQKSTPVKDSDTQMQDVNVGPSESSRNIISRVNIGGMTVGQVLNKPFAMIDEINESSPAAEDGLQLGDQILKFGNVESADNLLPRLAAEAQTNQGRPIQMVVIRQGAPAYLTVTPRTWEGRGLLGCHFRIL